MKLNLNPTKTVIECIFSKLDKYLYCASFLFLFSWGQNRPIRAHSTLRKAFSVACTWAQQYGQGTSRCFFSVVLPATNREVKMENSKYRDKPMIDSWVIQVIIVPTPTPLKGVCLFICFHLRPRERWLFCSRVGLLFCSSQHTAFVNSQPMNSSFAHKTVENKNIGMKMDLLSVPTLNGWNINNGWIFTLIVIPTVTLASCWVCPVGKKRKTKGTLSSI